MDPVVILASESLAVAPGEQTEIGVRVLNRGRRVESYRIDVVGDVAAFATVRPDTISVLPGREEQVQVTFSSPSGPSARPGSYRFGVRAVSAVDPTSSALAEAMLELGGASGVRAWLGTSSTGGRWSGHADLHLENLGNKNVRLAVTAHDPTGDLRVNVAPDVVDLLPGVPTVVQVGVKTNRPFLSGTAVSRVVQIATHDCPFGAERPRPGQAGDPDDPHHETFQITFEQRPIVSKWMLAAAILLVVAVVAFVVWRIRGTEEVELAVGEPYVPAEFEAISLGSSAISLEWLAVPNAARYEVWQSSGDGATIDAIEPVEADEPRTEIGELEASREHCFKVRAVGHDDQMSDFSDHKCATTDPEPVIPPPDAVNATYVGEGIVELQISYPADQLGSLDHFEPIVGARAEAPIEIVGESPITGSVAVPLEAEPRTVQIWVKAVTADGDTSDEFGPVSVEIPALPPATTVASTDGAGSEGDAESGAAGETDGGGGAGADGAEGGGGATTTTSSSTTTVAPTTTLAPAVALADPLYAQRWVAMVPVVGLTEQQRALAESVIRTSLSAQVPGEEVRVFSNRDHVAVASEDSEYTPGAISGIEATAGSRIDPDERFLYAIVADQADAQVVCAEVIGCFPARIVAAPAQRQISVQQTLSPDIELAQLDELLIDLRAAAPGRAIHVLDSRDWTQADGGTDLDGTGLVIFEVDLGDADPLCDAETSCLEPLPDPESDG